MSKVHDHVWEVHVSEASESEVSETSQLCWAHGFSCEDLPLQVGMSVQVLQGIGSVHFFAKVLLGVVKPFKIFSLNLEGECLVLLS